jgi:hypothetical protein
MPITTAGKYDRIPAWLMPAGVIWTVPGRNAGQVVEVAYSRGIPAGKPGVSYEADDGDKLMRITGSGGPLVTYHQRSGSFPAEYGEDRSWDLIFADVCAWQQELDGLLDGEREMADQIHAEWMARLEQGRTARGELRKLTAESVRTALGLS